jgi:hypothetical protein
MNAASRGGRARSACSTKAPQCKSVATPRARARTHEAVREIARAERAATATKRSRKSADRRWQGAHRWLDVLVASLNAVVASRSDRVVSLGLLRCSIDRAHVSIIEKSWSVDDRGKTHSSQRNT